MCLQQVRDGFVWMILISSAPSFPSLSPSLSLSLEDDLALTKILSQRGHQPTNKQTTGASLASRPVVFPSVYC